MLIVEMLATHFLWCIYFYFLFSFPLICTYNSLHICSQWLHIPSQLPLVWYIGCDHNSLWRGVTFTGERKKMVISGGKYLATLCAIIFDGLRSIFISNIGLLGCLWQHFSSSLLPLQEDPNWCTKFLQACYGRFLLKRSFVRGFSFKSLCICLISDICSVFQGWFPQKLQ